MRPPVRRNPLAASRAGEPPEEVGRRRVSSHPQRPRDLQGSQRPKGQPSRTLPVPGTYRASLAILIYHGGSDGREYGLWLGHREPWRHTGTYPAPNSAATRLGSSPMRRASTDSERSKNPAIPVWMSSLKGSSHRCSR